MNTVWDEEGCFVFQVVNSSIVVRSQPTLLEEDMTRLEFDVNELVSVDLIHYPQDPKLFQDQAISSQSSTASQAAASLVAPDPTSALQQQNGPFVRLTYQNLKQQAA